ncbi:arsenical pump membrane domain protein [Bordetella holmesii 41130]|nr:arsenical pump membrane domain protein [Bordetella holmesii 41130]
MHRRRTGLADRGGAASGYWRGLAHRMECDRHLHRHHHHQPDSR